jgi:hypothetical protein
LIEDAKAKALLPFRKQVDLKLFKATRRINPRSVEAHAVLDSTNELIGMTGFKKTDPYARQTFDHDQSIREVRT